MSSKQELLNNVTQRLYSLLQNENASEIKNLIYNNQNLKNTNPNFDMDEFKKIVLKNIGSLEKNSIKNYVNKEIFSNNENKRTISEKIYSSSNTNEIKNHQQKIIINNTDDFFNAKNEIKKNSPNLNNFSNQNQNNFSNQKKNNFSNQNLDNEKIRDLFKGYDVQNNNMINSNDVYFALIETAQQYPDLLEVPSYGLVTGIVKDNFGSKKEISYHDFLNILNEIKNNS